MLKSRQRLVPYTLMMPFLLFWLTFVMYPVFKNLFMSLTQWGVSTGYVKFVGLRNYRYIFDPKNSFLGKQFWSALWVTIQYLLYSVPVFVGASLALALAVNSQKLGRSRSLFRTLFFLPVCLPITVVAAIWGWIFMYSGVANYIIGIFGAAQVPWLTQLPGVWVSIIVATLWGTVGFNMIILIGGLQSIPQELYDAAYVDGANGYQRFIHITLPQLMPVLLFVLITQILGSFNLFAQPQLMTAGGPGRSTLPIMYFIYQKAFGATADLMGFSSAAATVTTLIIAAVIVAWYTLFSRRTD